MNISEKIKSEFGNIDIYLFDQLLKGRLDNCKVVLDAGCGNGRNLRFFLNKQFEVYGVDKNTNLESNTWFSSAKIEDLPFSDKKFDFIICNAVLHFAKDENHFDKMLSELWRVLNLNGILFIRLATSIGIEQHIKLINGRMYKLPDGTDRFLVDEKYLMDFVDVKNAELLDPIKTTIVQNLRSMTTLVLRK